MTGCSPEDQQGPGWHRTIPVSRHPVEGLGKSVFRALCCHGSHLTVAKRPGGKLGYGSHPLHFPPTFVLDSPSPSRLGSACGWRDLSSPMQI